MFDGFICLIDFVVEAMYLLIFGRNGSKAKVLVALRGKLIREKIYYRNVQYTTCYQQPSKAYNGHNKYDNNVQQ